MDFRYRDRLVQLFIAVSHDRRMTHFASGTCLLLAIEMQEGTG